MSKLKKLAKLLKEEAYLRRTKPNYEHIDEILNREEKEGTFNFRGSSFTKAYDDKLVDDSWLSRTIKEVETPEGPRNYIGEGDSFDRNTSRTLSGINAALNSVMFPADSVTTDELKLLQKHGLFEDE